MVWGVRRLSYAGGTVQTVPFFVCLPRCCQSPEGSPFFGSFPGRPAVPEDLRCRHPSDPPEGPGVRGVTGAVRGPWAVLKSWGSRGLPWAAARARGVPGRLPWRVPGAAVPRDETRPVRDLVEAQDWGPSTYPEEASKGVTWSLGRRSCMSPEFPLGGHRVRAQFLCTAA